MNYFYFRIKDTGGHVVHEEDCIKAPSAAHIRQFLKEKFPDGKVFVVRTAIPTIEEWWEYIGRIGK